MAYCFMTFKAPPHLLNLTPPISSMVLLVWFVVNSCSFILTIDRVEKLLKVSDCELGGRWKGGRGRERKGEGRQPKE